MIETRVLTPDAKRVVNIQPGWTAAEAIKYCVPVESQHTAMVFKDGTRIIDVENFTVCDGDSIMIACVPQGGGGGKQILGAVLMVVVAVAAWYIAPAIVAGSMAAAGAGLTTIGAVAVAAGITLVGSLAMSALIPPPSISTAGLGTSSAQTTTDSSQTYAITGQSNSARKYGVVAKIYGRYKAFPTLAATPEVRNVGTESTIRALYDFGVGNYQIEELKIGETEYANFGAQLVLHHNTRTPALVFAGKTVHYDQFSFELKQSNPVTVKTRDQATEFIADISFPRGLTYFNDAGGQDGRSVLMNIQYRNINGGDWIPVRAAGQIHGVSAEQDVAPAYRYEAFFSVSQALKIGAGALPPLPISGVFDVAQETGEITRQWWLEGRLLFLDGFSGGGIIPRSILAGPILGSITAPNRDDFTMGAPRTENGVSGWEIVKRVQYMAPISDIKISGNTARPFVASVQVAGLAAGTYEIRFERKTADSSSIREYTQTQLTLLKSYKDKPILNLQSPHTMVEMYAVASDKLSGIVNNLNAIATSVLPIYDASGNVIGQFPTRNPAAICLDIMLGDATPKPLNPALIDWASWRALYDYCEANQYFADFVVDYSTTVSEILNSVLSLARASLRMTTSGRYGVLIDQRKTVPRQIITPANSWGFSGSRSFADRPHAFRVSFIDPESGWQKTEFNCYADGYNETNATKFEDLGTFGITNHDQAWKFGRYMMKQGIHRSETFTVTMDIENIVVVRGDLVWVQHDVPNIGGQPGRVVSVSGNIVEVNTNLGQVPDGYSVRLQDGTIRSGKVINAIDGDHFEFDDATGIEPDDLLVLGMMTRVTNPYLVTGITPGADLTADIALVKYVDIYDDTATIPPWNPGFGDDMINVSNLKIVTLTAEQVLRHINRMPFADITLQWTVSGFDYDHADVFVTAPGFSQILLGSSKTLSYEWLIDILNSPSYVGLPIEFEVVPVNSNGLYGTGAKVTITPEPDRIRPSDITGFGVNVQDMQTSIFWDAPQDPDIDHFTLRYSPDPLHGTWGASSLIGIFPWNITRTTVGSRTGKYFLQAADTSGNVSNLVWQRTTVETLPGIVPHIDVNDAPNGWPGALSNVSVVGGKVQLNGKFGEIVPLGYYHYAGIVDLNDVFEVRVSSKVLARGISQADVMANWVPIAIARPLASARSDQWNVQTEYRVIDDVQVMADWLPLASAVPIAAASTNWSEWRPIQVGDITARFLQFRLRIESFDPNIRAVVNDGLIEVVSVKRTWSDYDVQIPAEGKRILYDVPFMTDPSVSITIDGNNDIFRYNITDKNRFGFDIQLLDEALKPQAGQIDIQVLGSGKQRTTSI